MTAAAEPDVDALSPRPGLRARLMLVGAAVLARLPEPPLVAAADSIGELWYRLSPARAAQARANLRRVCEGLDAQGRGTRLARRAATDPEALELLVRRCFRHAVRYYLEVAQTARYDADEAVARIDVETPDEVRRALASGAPSIILGMHFGAIELPAIYIVNLVGKRVTAPMEAVSDPALQRWFMDSRGRVGVDIIPVKDARRALLRALRRGDWVGLVNDRDVVGNGLPVPFFGAPAPISPGPALLALETGTPIYVASARRIGGGHYAGRMLGVPMPGAGTRRERVTALTASVAAAFESLLADAPEQWWGAFHPIWPDLAIGDAGTAHGDAGQVAAGGDADAGSTS